MNQVTGKGDEEKGIKTKENGTISKATKQRKQGKMIRHKRKNMKKKSEIK